MNKHDSEIYGFLDVKLVGNKYITQKVKKKALTLSKVWKRFWCSVKKLEPGLGVQLHFNIKLNYSSSALKQNGKNNSDNCVIIPSNAIIYRIHSKTKQFAFCIASRKDRRPLVSLSANSETEAQRWMANIRYLLNPRKYCSREKCYNVSIVDNTHSKAAGLTGLHGDLFTSKAGIFIKNVSTAETVESFEWKEFNQFHLMTTGRPEDVKRVCVIHTTKEFRCGIGELHIFCLEANKLLQDLVTQGRGPKRKQNSCSFNEENLEALTQHNGISNSLLHPRSDTLPCILNAETICETKENIYQPECNLMHSEKIESCNHKTLDISEIYEEIMDNACSSKSKTFPLNVYENIDKKYNLPMEPPPLPPRQNQNQGCISEDRVNIGQYSHTKTSDSETRLQNTKVDMQETIFADSYVLMSPQLKDNNILESDGIAKNSKENDYITMG